MVFLFRTLLMTFLVFSESYIAQNINSHMRNTTTPMASIPYVSWFMSLVKSLWHGGGGDEEAGSPVASGVELCVKVSLNTLSEARRWAVLSLAFQ